MIDLSVLILAGGGSSRLGVCKQMIQYHDRTLIQNACYKATQLSKSVTVVTGAYHHRVEAEISHLPVDILFNEDWSSGIASSLSVAIKRQFNSDRVLVMYCDQPYIPLTHYQSLIELSDKEKQVIVATEYDDIFSIPAIFPHHLFYELTTHESDDPALDVINKHMSELRSISCQKAAFSVDTAADMAALKK